QCERFALPCAGTMEVDHLIADVDRTRLGILRYLQAKAAIKCQHGFRVLHGKSHVVETAYPAGLLKARSHTAGSHTRQELSPGNTLLRVFHAELICRAAEALFGADSGSIRWK